MSRSFTYSALTLRVKASGESNREAWFLTAEEGLIKATLFGGPKSRLRAQTAPYHSGTLWIYHDPVRDSRKVSDFDVHSYRTGIRELWERAMTAGAIAETVLSSHGGGGGWPFSLQLSEGVLDALDSSDAETCSRIGIYFLWQWAQVLGVRPELSACGACACEPKRDGVLWYSMKNESLFCEDCLRRFSQGGSPPQAGMVIKVGPGALQWLKTTEHIAPASLARVSMDTPSLEQARVFSKAVLAAALGKKLPTWEAI